MRTRQRIMKERIAVNPQIHFGKPCVAGTRITVQSVLELVDEGVSFDEINRDYYFGALVFVNVLGAGVIYLRILPSTQQAVHDELERVLTTYSEEKIKGICRHRARRTPV